MKEIEILQRMGTQSPLMIRRAISEFYPLSIDFIDKEYGLFETKLDFDLILSNENIDWNEQFINKFHETFDDFNWDHLSSNKALPWSIDFIKKYKKFWNWYRLSYSDQTWTEEIIEAFSDKWDWKGLSSSKQIPWSKQLVDRFFYKIDFEEMSQNLNFSWLENFVKNKIESITNDVLQFCDEHSIEVKDWEWSSTGDVFVFRERPKDWFELSKSKSIDWSIEYIARRKQYWHWHNLSKNNSIPWSYDLIRKFEKDWDWDNLSYNESIPFDEKIIKSFSEKWNWKILSGNKNFPWTEKLIDENIDKIDWGYLSGNINLCWTNALIKKYFEKLDWRNISQNEGVEWSIGFIYEYFDNLNHFLIPEKIIFQTILSKLKDEDIYKILDAEKALELEDKVGYKIFGNDDETWGNSLYDNEYYNDELDLDQQGPDFDM